MTSLSGNPNGSMADRLSGYAQLTYFALSHLNRFRDRLLRDQFHRQVFEAGISALPIIIVLAIITGATTVTQLSALAGPDSDLAQQLLFFGLFFELAPLLSALVIVARSSAAVASELAIMRLHDEYAVLRRLGVPAADFLLLPRIAAFMLALPLATIIFQSVAMSSGWVAVAVLHNRPLADISGSFLELASPGITLLALTKSTVMGLLVGVIAAHHGGTAEKSPHAVSVAAIQAVGGGLIAVFLVDIAFALLVYLVK
jgi:phospholipid/cholesterol/gamma-HCH transport system permease protein